MYTKDSIKKIGSIPIVKLFPSAETKGNKYYCRCPKCGGQGWKKSKWKGLTINPEKGTICNACGFKSGKKIIDFYASVNNLDSKKDFIKIVESLANDLGETLEKEKENWVSEYDGRPIPGSFAYRQLVESGLTPEDVKAEVIENGKIVKIPVFQRGALNMSTGDIDYFADEMVILYYDLEGRRKKYIPKGSRSAARQKDYTRVRWSNPEGHQDSSGKPIKYQTPAGARAEIYIPQKIRDAYKNQVHIETLIVQEGEKKAEKACKHGIYSIGVQGIFGTGSRQDGLPSEIQYITQKCGVKNLVLLFDSDWNNLNSVLENESDVEKRPNQFSKAAIKFKAMVRTLHQIGLHVDIWFGHINENNAAAKGIDDLLCGPLAGREEKLKEDIDKAMLTPSGISEYVSIYNISTQTDFQIRDYWNLNYDEQFFEKHRDRLLELKTFRFGGVFYNIIDGEIKRASEYGSGSEFWDVSYNDKGDKIIKLSIIDTKSFLEGNGFRSFIDEEGYNTFVRIDRGIISKLTLPDIHRFVFTYVTKASRDKSVHEYFANNIDNKLTQGKMNLLEPLITRAGIPEQYVQKYYYKNVQISITEDDISIEKLIGPVWEKNLINRNFNRVSIFKYVNKQNENSFDIELTEEGKECEFLRYLINCSSFPDENDVEQLDTTHLVNKLTCIGYLLRQYRSHAEKKAVIGMDTRMSEVGESNGRSGKSIIGFAISKMVEQAFIDGRQLKESDEFTFNEVRNTTRNIFIDDIKVNFDFAKIYSAITGDLNVNVKGGKRFTIPFENSPKIYITTNHTIKSEGESTDDRIVYMGFSSHYNIEHTPIMEFGHEFFTEWDEYQWSLFDNLMIECVRLYMLSIKLGWTKEGCGAVPPPMESINLRRERQIMGEAFFQWAEAYFSNDGENLNSRLIRKDIYSDFIKENPQQQRFVSTNSLKVRIKAFCKFKGYHFNPHKLHEKEKIDFSEWTHKHPGASFFGGEDKTCGREYFTIADQNFSNIKRTPSVLETLENNLPY